MDRKSGFDEPLQNAPQAVAEAARAPRVASREAVDPRITFGHATWQASSFDLAQGLNVKEMQSKLSPETLDRLFRS